jgi:ABC-type nickel/cobalt efflux system permease component RcnA
MELLGPGIVIGRLQVQVVIACAVVVFALGIIVTGGEANPKWLQFYSYAVLAGVGALFLWDRWIWRTAWPQKLKAVPHDLNGTWEGVLTSFWKDPATGVSPPPKPAFLVIRQTSSTTSVTMLTDEMKSGSTFARVTRLDGDSSIAYMYLSKPANRVADRSRMHHGSTTLDISGTPATRLCGHYWTDRDSRGELDFTHRSAKHADDFQEAQGLFDAGS